MYKITWKEWELKKQEKTMVTYGQVEKSLTYENYDEAAIKYLDIRFFHIKPDSLYSLSIFEDDKDIRYDVESDEEIFEKWIEKNDISDEDDIDYYREELGLDDCITEEEQQPIMEKAVYKITYTEEEKKKIGKGKKKTKTFTYKDYDEAAIKFLHLFLSVCEDPDIYEKCSVSIKIFKDDKDITEDVQYDEKAFKKYLRYYDINDEFDISFLRKYLGLDD